MVINTKISLYLWSYPSMLLVKLAKYFAYTVKDNLL